MYGWVGRILWIDLSSGDIRETETSPYIERLIGGRGIAAKLMWEITTADVDARPLIFMTGPLTGTVAPFGGRTVVAGYAPQGYPHEWYSRSTFGGHWGSELKYAGYDGLVIVGRSDSPVYLFIDDRNISLHDASAIWGCGIYETQERLRKTLGSQTAILTIGQAGENRSRIAVIQTETESAAGQGGFGAVMGEKKLKAIAVRGTGAVHVAEPGMLLRYSKAIRDELRAGSMFARRSNLDLGRNAEYNKRGYACTQQCGVECIGSYHYSNVPGPVTGKLRSGHIHCTAPGFEGRGVDNFYNWNLGFEAGFDIASLANDYGLNHWELHFSIMPWLRYCEQNGIRKKLDGLKIDIGDARFWAEIIRKIAYREGLGSVLAEGGYRAVKELGWAEDFLDELYAGWGYAGHWDGHGDRINRIVYPFWLVPALQWSVDTRDPTSSSHGYSHVAMLWSPLQSEVDVGLPEGAGGHGKGYLSWNRLREVSERVYGSPWALDPYAEYRGKAYAAAWHANRSAIKDSLPICDWMFPCFFSLNQLDLWARANGIDGIDFERYLFAAVTGIHMSHDEFHEAGERICNIERALQIRDFGRSRSDDEAIIPYVSSKEWWPNPLFDDEHIGADAGKFQTLLTEFYQLRGWVEETGRPTSTGLKQLGLDDVARGLKQLSM
jgi:aldehyde:ferredoxin oxidoreductase